MSNNGTKTNPLIKGSLDYLKNIFIKAGFKCICYNFTIDNRAEVYMMDNTTNSEIHMFISDETSFEKEKIQKTKLLTIHLIYNTPNESFLKLIISYERLFDGEISEDETIKMVALIPEDLKTKMTKAMDQIKSKNLKAGTHIIE